MTSQHLTLSVRVSRYFLILKVENQEANTLSVQYELSLTQLMPSLDVTVSTDCSISDAARRHGLNTNR